MKRPIYNAEDILPHLGFLPESLQHTVAWMFTNPARGGSYLLQLTDERFELMPKCVPAQEHVPMLENLFQRLYPGYDITDNHGWTCRRQMYQVEHVCTHVYK